MSAVVARISERGAAGEGEAAGVYYLGDDVARMWEAIEHVRRDIEAGVDRESLQSLLPPGGARNALDCALWDLEAQRLGQPVWRIAGLERPRPLLTTLTIQANDPATMAEMPRSLMPWRSLKLKLTGELPLDAERVRAVRTARPDAWIGVDANQGYTPASLSALMPDLVACKVKLVEQPLARGREAELDGLRCPIPVAADESVCRTFRHRAARRPLRRRQHQARQVRRPHRGPRDGRRGATPGTRRDGRQHGRAPACRWRRPGSSASSATSTTSTARYSYRGIARPRWLSRTARSPILTRAGAPRPEREFRAELTIL